jgi:4-amino-4-deoxy-L-arabinose transferase-like glycosyltransferase
MSEICSGCSARLAEHREETMSGTYGGYTQGLAERRELGARVRRPLHWLLVRLGAHHAALIGVLALSVVLNTHRLSQNGYANTFYSAGVKSMLRSLHNFLYVSFDPGGLVTIDKPPLGVWVQVGSAKLFGLSPLSLLLPQALLATLTVLVLYRALSPRLGVGGALGGALALAVFPSFVAASRDNGVDTVLILLMMCSCWAMLSAIESGRLLPLIASAVLVGLAFNTKTLAAYLVIPGIALGYLVCAPRSLPRRVVRLALAGLVIGAVSFSWIALVELTPAHSRPFVGSSTDNSELGLTFGYNGFGRVQGEIGGPGRIPIAAGAIVQAPARVNRASKPQRPPSTNPPRWTQSSRSNVLPNGRYRNPIAFGEPVGLWRLFGKGLGDQGAWMLPFALAGLLALALSLLGNGRRAAPPGDAPSLRRDPRLALTLVLGGWFLSEVVVLSFSKGIVHPYYVSALGPPAAAMVGAGACILVRFAQRRDWRMGLLPCAVAATVGVQLLLLHQQRYMQWFAIPLVTTATVGVALMAIRRLATAGMVLTLVGLTVAPAAFAATTWLAPVYGTFPAAGPHEATGRGLFGLSRKNVLLDRALLDYVATHSPGRRWRVLTDASPTAAPLILMGLDAGALAGYSGTDPALDGPTLAGMVAHREARYVVLGGAYASRGGNLATRAVLSYCREIPARAWHGHRPSPHTLVLFDCAGRERELASGPRYRDL